jgi:DeoR/GlpR family transcriptional regulator of sugar metabolism
MARVSALGTVKAHGQATVKDVMREQGLAEINAMRALKELATSGNVRKTGRYYVFVSEG